MINTIVNVNWIAVLLAFVAYFFLGAMWFTVLFSKQYKRSLGRKNDEPQKIAPIFFIGPALCTLVITIACAMLMAALHVESYGRALEFSLIVGVGYLFANTVNIAINPNIPRPLLYGFISGTYHLTGISLLCAILITMQ